MSVIQLLLRKDLPYSETNNPDEFYKLSRRKQDILVDWIETVLKPYEIKSYNNYNSSYSLKHLFQYNGGFYVTNGEFKGAMFEAGLYPKEYETKNWTFKLAKKHVNIKPYSQTRNT